MYIWDTVGQAFASYDLSTIGVANVFIMLILYALALAACVARQVKMYLTEDWSKSIICERPDCLCQPSCACCSSVDYFWIMGTTLLMLS